MKEGEAEREEKGYKKRKIQKNQNIMNYWRKRERKVKKTKEKEKKTTKKGR